MTEQQLQQLAQRINDGYLISADEARAIAAMPNKQAIWAAANDVRKHFMGNAFDLCSIINAKSGRCSEDCKWCSQSHKHHTGIAEYPMVDKATAVQMAIHNQAKGVRRFSLVTSGRTLTDAQLQQILDIIADIRKHTDIGLCASMGLLTEEQLRKLHEAGVERYHCNIETAPSHFGTLCSTHTTADKVATLRAAQRAGLATCSGGIIGMGETMEQRIEMALFVRDLGVVSVPINVLMPIKGTPLENQPPLSPEEILTTFALFRLINPTAYIRMAGGRAAFRAVQSEALQCGINASIVGDMLTTIGAKTIDEDVRDFAAAGFTL